MGRPRKSYFGENDCERSGLLSSGSQDAIAEAGSNYQGLGRTVTPHSLSAPAGLDSALWDEGYEARPEESQEEEEEEERRDQPTEPADADLIVIN